MATLLLHIGPIRWSSISGINLPATATERATSSRWEHLKVTSRDCITIVSSVDFVNLIV